MDIIIPTPRDIIATVIHGEIPMAWVTWLARISKSSSAIDIIKPMNIPNITTFIILSNRPKKSPIIVPILEIERSTQDKNMERPIITPKDPRVNLIRRFVEIPTKKFRINTKIIIGTTALVFSLI